MARTKHFDWAQGIAEQMNLRNRYRGVSVEVSKENGGIRVELKRDGKFTPLASGLNGPDAFRLMTALKAFNDTFNFIP